MADPKTAPHDWSERILRLAAELRLTQAGLAERLGVSPATVSRWIQENTNPLPKAMWLSATWPTGETASISGSARNGYARLP
jgi:transcriptional regulator with XRE-family HTH domain